MRFLPVFLDLTQGSVALIGAGEAALNKLRLLCAAGAHVRWIVDPADLRAARLQLVALDQAKITRVDLIGQDIARIDLNDHVAVIAAVGSPLAEVIAARARSTHLPVNVVDRPELSSFIIPAIIDRDDVVVAVGTGGASPVLARRLRERIESLLPERIGALARWLGERRAQFAAVRHGSVSLRRFWERVIDGPIAAAFLSGRVVEAEAALQQAIADSASPQRQGPGTVYLVGAGPGDPDLLTLRALNALQAADIIFHDDLIGDEILRRARRDAELEFVGKRRGAPGIGQEAINSRLIAAARAGRTVVRLKGGDPFIFGRGGEEVAALRQAGIPVVVVPGITAALGCAAEVELPLTQRNEATRLCLVTAHRAADAVATNWQGLGSADTTVVVYMGLSAAAAVRDGLVGAGRDPATPAAVLARGTSSESRQMFGHLNDLPDLAARAGNGPALLVIGNVVSHAAAWPHTLGTLLMEFEAAA